MIKKDSPIIYILVALIGATLLTISYHFSLQNKYKICALIPALPIIGLTGLFFLTLNKGNSEGYILNHIRFLLITTSLYFFTLVFLTLSFSTVLSTLGSSTATSGFSFVFAIIKYYIINKIV